MISFSVRDNGLQEQIYEQIKDRIMSGDPKPGERLNVDRLAREAGVSITPVREALARLVAEHLVVFRPNKGYRVTEPPDASWLADLFDVRMLLEPYAARLGAVKRDECTLSRLLEFQQRISSLDTSEVTSRLKFVRLNKHMHTLIIESAGNRALMEQYTTLSYHTQIAHIYSQGLQDLEEVLEEHVPILDAYCKQDGRMAEEAMQEHIAAGKRRALDFVAKGVVVSKG